MAETNTILYKELSSNEKEINLKFKKESTTFLKYVLDFYRQEIF